MKNRPRQLRSNIKIVEVEVEDRKEEIEDQAHMIGQVPMIDQRVEIDPTVEIEVVEIEIKIQEIKEEIQVLDILQICSVIFVR